MMTSAYVLAWLKAAKYHIRQCVISPTTTRKHLARRDQIDYSRMQIVTLHQYQGESQMKVKRVRNLWPLTSPQGYSLTVARPALRLPSAFGHNPSLHYDTTFTLSAIFHLIEILAQFL
jgi:hypothetical protein